jgi:hypothetical protein
MSQHDEPSIDTATPVDDDRRKFLAACGKFAVVTPPALTVLLSTSLNSNAMTRSGGHYSGGNQDGGNQDGGDQDGGHNHGSTPGGQDFLTWLENLLDKIL